jgi:hypothetical protein
MTTSGSRARVRPAGGLPAPRGRRESGPCGRRVWARGFAARPQTTATGPAPRSLRPDGIDDVYRSGSRGPGSVPCVQGSPARAPAHTGPERGGEGAHRCAYPHPGPGAPTPAPFIPRHSGRRYTRRLPGDWRSTPASRTRYRALSWPSTDRGAAGMPLRPAGPVIIASGEGS